MGKLLTDETETVDRGSDFDQVREHDHRPGVYCWCGSRGVPVPEVPANNGVTADMTGAIGESAESRESATRNPQSAIERPLTRQPENEFTREVPAFILEQKVLRLEGDLRIAEQKLLIAETENDILCSRILAFESMVKRLAEFIDHRPNEISKADVSQVLCGQRSPLTDGLSCVLRAHHSGSCFAGDIAREPLKAA